MNKLLNTIFIALPVAALLMPAQAQTTLDTLAGIQNSIKHYPEQIRSLRCQITIKTTFSSGSPSGSDLSPTQLPAMQTEQVKWAFRGNKLINESRQVTGEGAGRDLNFITTSLFDGSKSYMIESQDGGSGSRVTYANRQSQSTTNALWSPLNFGYKADGRWLRDVLNSNPVLERGGQDQRYGPLYVVHVSITDMGPSVKEARIWFAPRYNNVAVKVVEEGPTGQWTLEGEQFRCQGKLWLPARAKFQVLQRENGRFIPRITKEFAFQDIEVNTVSDAAFKFAWPTGTGLWDEDSRTKYRRDAMGNWIAMPNYAKNVTHNYDHLSAAEVIPWVFLMSLVTFLTLGAIRWRKRNSS